MARAPLFGLLALVLCGGARASETRLTLASSINAKLVQTAVLLGARPRLDLQTKLCSVEGPSWATVGGDGRSLAIDPQSFEPGWLTVRTADEKGSCEEGKKLRLLLAPGDSLKLGSGTASVYVQSRVAEVVGEALREFQLVAVQGGRVAALHACPTDRACSLPLSGELVHSWILGEPTGVVLWPAVLPVAVGEELPGVPLDSGDYAKLEDMLIEEPRFLFTRPLVEPIQIDASEEGPVVLPVSEPGAIEEVTCKRARCSLSPRGIEIFAVDSATLSVSLRMQLRPGCFRSVDGKLSSREAMEVPVVRCGMRVPADVPLLAGVSAHRYFVGMPRDCFARGIDELLVETHPPTAAYVRSESAGPDDSWRFFEIVIDRVPEGSQQLELTLSSRVPQRTTLGAVQIQIADYRPLTARLEIEGQGLVAFIPVNREARLDLVADAPRWLTDLRVVDRPGFYVARQDHGKSFVRAVNGALGTVALRIGYVPASFTAMLHREEVLANIDTEARHELRSINAALPLTEPAAGGRRFVRVECRRGNEIVDVPPGHTVSIPYRDRDSCRVLLDQQAIPEWAGEQRLRVDTEGTQEIITVAHQEGVIAIAVAAGGKPEFASLSVSVSHEYASGHYDLSPRANLGPEARYRIVLGDGRFRVSASTSLPTGIFRFGNTDDRGAVALSAGAVGRIVYLYKEGAEFPIGWELGILGTGLSSDPDLSIVTGLGFSIPVLNADTPLQTSFNLHAWAEYSPTRTGPKESAWAFLFGPSFSIGHFSTNL